MTAMTRQERNAVDPAVAGAPQAARDWASMTPESFGLTAGSTVPLLPPAGASGTLDLFDGAL